MEFIIAFALIIITLIYFLTRKNVEKKDNKRDNNTKNKNDIPKKDNKTDGKMIEMTIQDDKINELVANNKDFIVNHFREAKEIKNCHISLDGKIILMSDVIYLKINKFK
jgi:hypothetical protein